MSRNSVRLSAILATLDPLRHTPAGIPVIEFRLTHASQQLEAGHQRQVEFEMACKAAGELAGRVAGMHAGDPMTVEGFLNRRHHKSQQVILHVTNIELN